MQIHPLSRGVHVSLKPDLLFKLGTLTPGEQVLEGMRHMSFDKGKGNCWETAGPDGTPWLSWEWGREAQRGGIWKENTKGIAPKAIWAKSNSPKLNLVFSSQSHSPSQLPHLCCSTWKPAMGPQLLFLLAHATGLVILTSKHVLSSPTS